jgi:hypothetical protein
MAMKDIKIKEFVAYNGSATKANGVVTLNLKAMYSELTNTIKVLQLLNNDVKITVNDEKVLGVFRVKDVVIDGDGQSKLKFESMSEAVEMSVMNSLVNIDGEFSILMQSKVDLEDAEDEDEEAEETSDDDEDWDDVEDDDDWGDEDE